MPMLNECLPFLFPKLLEVGRDDASFVSYDQIGFVHPCSSHLPWMLNALDLRWLLGIYDMKIVAFRKQQAPSRQ